MCGIVGYIGAKDSKEILLNGLEKLEYRGYDSAGIYVLKKAEEGYLFKEKGRMAALREKVDDSVKATAGIGHTRWATHGAPSVRNAHPHQSVSERFTIVHNGVIENYQEIKDAYLSDVEQKSDTDTEIIVQLISWFVESEDLETIDAFKKAIVALEGSYAIALMDNQNPDVIYAAKNKSPLLLGKGDGFNVICSDAMAMIKETNQFVELMDKEIATVTRESLIIEDFTGEKIKRAPYTAEIDSDDFEKGTYPYYMLKEIDEQPAVMRKLLLKYQDENNNLTVDQAIVDAILESDRVYIIAAGTSYNGGLVGKELIEKMTHIPTEVHVSSEFGYNTPILSEKPFFIFLSQSGETADSRQVLVKTNALGHPSLTVTNVAGSTLSRESNFTLLLNAGPEIAVASTKAYTAQIAVLAILSEVIGIEKGLINKGTMLHDIGIAANAIQSIIDDKEKIESLASDYLSTSRNAFYIGRGMDYHVALEAALKLKEISYIQTEGFAAGELKHGTIALIEEDTPVIALVTEKRVAGHTRGNLQETKARGAHAMVISMEGLDRPEDQIVIPHVNPLLSALVSVIPTQLLAYYCSLHRGNDVDKPRNLAKSVTVE
ncbi:MAG: glutamine--fructose-6-phosphate transaminase (isomerizing) [Alkalibacterium sp.]|uniref:glutamine--fructose-6-phosphate transaminase (isomerizing) n=1 Tax=Alkalibacterium TaxID=99906 RepID=UPI0026489878|nr:glutamine--fructose-6-phosphate transaminase (isomerizing) [Alkalibacterium sp.]MDN6193427.1 glutamine--fructose-6-phosphate transaminase (isomerizing) [Alkalibacterium sp.]MDN6294672.1 glutamine--fructose-6-phosphate transaminase (isomerizing) [Alkalibacterium sp.]MDN6295827.1 glutamine--fructose-6-phosphate transaminase (isomerizing) [Alkalibacterium sp.]MDN6326488.1 glutamine--fructose-6-phosphate transaminase (isomerizing) [Alkalibacterium sp.]MDN6729185.1 glutamine--fructose-6-phosphat